VNLQQVKELTDAARLRFSLLVCAMASRDNDLVIQVMRDIGLVVENCSPEFQVRCSS
jgi:predicted unusual protein kinase regulating ubiquinone biosynthesis (AarF/ABC1/UbiB family)